MRAKYAREIRAGINSVRVPYKVGGCAEHGYFSTLDFNRLRHNEMEAARFAGSRLYESARRRTGYRRAEFPASCFECA